MVPLMLEGLYGKELKNDEPGSARSADVIVPLVMELVAPSSVVDVGCGLASWLAAFAHFGVPRIFGVDGPWVDESALRIPPDRFLAADLTQPLRLDEHFDLVVSLEVGEHLPADAADTFIDSLVALWPCSPLLRCRSRPKEESGTLTSSGLTIGLGALPSGASASWTASVPAYGAMNVSSSGTRRTPSSSRTTRGTSDIAC